MTSAEIRQGFLDFFRGKEHTIVPSSPLLPDSPNLLFTNAGMNQFVPIFLGQAPCPYKPPRAADTQKCIRAGGKHNDLEDVGLDTYHHTFFEMLGNWSFGDYFKAEAIAWAWELLTGVWGIPKERLYATVYMPQAGEPASFDEEAASCWEKIFRDAGLDPRERIVHGNKKDNFWMMGETGPCGPCSEIHIDLTPQGDTGGKLVNAGSAQCMEIWNLVFIQFNAEADGTFKPLPARHVDTGAGFERICAVIQCTKNFKDFSGVISNYETDVFRPIFEAIEKISGKKYASTLPNSEPRTQNPESNQEKTDIAFRVIADHIRTLSFAIGDGILPSNEGRGYVLRRILRRAVRFGRTLGMHEPFFYKLVDVVASQMGSVFPEIVAHREKIAHTIQTEEQSFSKTLDRGIELFEVTRERVAKAGSREFPADEAFKLYDTYGFPIDLTDLMAREAGLSVDHAGFEKLMEEQRKRAREAQKKEIISVGALTWASENAATKFVGYKTRKQISKVNGGVITADLVGVCLAETPFYAEMGGQVGDTGVLKQGANSWRVIDTQRIGEVPVHILDGRDKPADDAEVAAEVDENRRQAIEGHHSVTHLFHWALHEVVSRDARQKGSYVGPDRLRFDFNHEALTPGQIMDIEKLVNQRIIENTEVRDYEVDYSVVKSDPSIMQFFGDKYGDKVRVVDIGGYSKELCGGTHVRATGEIGVFKIVKEGAVAAGVRRIEAVAGRSACDFLETLIDEKWLAAEKARSGWLKRRAELGKSPIAGGGPIKPAAALEKIRSGKYRAEDYETFDAGLRKLMDEAERWQTQLLELEKEMEKQRKAAEQRRALARSEELLERVRSRKDISYIIEDLGDASADYLRAIAESLKSKNFPGVAVLAGTSAGRAGLVAYVGPSAARRLQAGSIIKTLAPIIGGGGGGKPDFAQAGGKNPERIADALMEAERLVS